MKLLIDTPPRFVPDGYETDHLTVTPLSGLLAENHTLGIIVNLIERDHGANAAMKFRVDAEYTRRVREGRPFEIDGYGSVHPDGSSETQIVLLAQKDTARDLKAAGITDPLLMFTGSGVDHYLTADQMIQLVDEGKVWVQQMHAAQRALKSMDPIPDDYQSDSYWP